MIIARVFIKNTDTALDIPVQQGAHLGMLMAAVRTDGFLVADTFYVPYNEIKYVIAYEAEQAPGKVLHLVPQPDKPL